MNNLETTETRARYKEQESRIMMRSELSDDQKDSAIDALFDRYCAEYNCWGSNVRTQHRFGEYQNTSYSDEINGGLGIGVILILVLAGIGIGNYWDSIIPLVNSFVK